VLVWISFNYFRLFYERELLTFYNFAMLVVGFPACIELNCRAKETTYTEARIQDIFLSFFPVFIEFFFA
jgi:hypothetical protein